MSRTIAIVANWTTRIGGVVILILGVSFWTGNLLALRPLHQYLGFVLVIALWTLAVIAARAGAPVGQVVIAVAWGLVAPLLGLTQTTILVGGLHWVVQLIHLAVGLMLIGMAEGLARVVRARRLAAHNGMPASTA